MTTTNELPYEAWIVALLTLPKMGPARLHALLEHDGADVVWERLCSGQSLDIDRVASETLGLWRSAARAMSVDEHWAAIHSLGVSVDELGSSDYPERLRNDIEPPAVLFGLGSRIPDGPTVGIVGTRECTSYGQRCAFELGAALAESGVSVVSGLALGIDAAAHNGALSASSPTRGTPIGVVGSGLDIVYPKQNAALWSKVAEVGSLVSETPPGVGPQPWRFPARNRIIAGLSDALIVVESHVRGGSLLTVDEAQLRDVEIGAVPGPISSKSSAGSNRLLVDGATPILGVDDVLALIGYSPPVQLSFAEPAEVASALLDVLGWSPLTLEQVCARVTLPPSAVAAELERLVNLGICVRSGPWIERVK